MCGPEKNTATLYNGKFRLQIPKQIIPKCTMEKNTQWQIIPLSSLAETELQHCCWQERKKAYDDEDIAICEYGATVVGIEVARGIAMDEEEDIRMKEAVDMALSTLSYSEMDAVTKIFC